MSKVKITDEQLRQVVKDSSSVSDALRKLGLSPNGGTHGHYTKRIKNAKIPTDHFQTDRNLSGIKKGKLSANQILVKKQHGANRVKREYLLRAMLEMGIQYNCSLCKIKAEWQGKELTLQIDHIDGDRNNNLKENLRFLCPNCHSQTLTFGNKKPRRQCSSCCNMIQNNSRSGLCKSCFPRNKKITWPNDEELLAMLAKSNYTKVGKELGVSDNAIRKHLNK